MSSITRYTPRYTVADYVQWQGDWELWDGVAIAMSPAPNVRHQRVAGKLHLGLSQTLQKNDRCHCEVLYEVDWRVKQDTVVRPDLVVVCEPIDTPWLTSPPTLIVEVLSPSTARNDREYKRSLYEQQGVLFYLIVDPESKQIESLHLVDDKYQASDAVDFQLHEGCAISFNLASLWS